MKQLQVRSTELYNE